MYNHRPLALCVGLACATLCLTSTGARAAATADQLGQISHFRDHAQWLDALAAIEGEPFLTFTTELNLRAI